MFGSLDKNYLLLFLIQNDEYNSDIYSMVVAQSNDWVVSNTFISQE